MRAEALREFVESELQALAWEQWSQLGISGPRPAEPEQRAADPEALLLFTFHVARTDPRLFDEVLDWLAVNEPIVSVHRLRNLCIDDVDRALVKSALEWAAKARGRPTRDEGPAAECVPLFPSLPRISDAHDPVFAASGFARPPLQRSGKSQSPHFSDPISFALRLRRLLGVGVRAEVVRALLTIRAPWISGKVITSSAAFAQRNVREGLTQLTDAGVISVAGPPDDRLYSASYEDWSRVLRLDRPQDLPFHYDWIPVLRALVAIMRFLQQDGLDDLSPYLLASRARTLIDTFAPDLRFAGAPPEAFTAFGADFWTAFEGIARAAIRHARRTPS